MSHSRKPESLSKAYAKVAVLFALVCTLLFAGVPRLSQKESSSDTASLELGDNYHRLTDTLLPLLIRVPEQTAEIRSIELYLNGAPVRLSSAYESRLSSWRRGTELEVPRALSRLISLAEDGVNTVSVLLRSSRGDFLAESRLLVDKQAPEIYSSEFRAADGKFSILFKEQISVPSLSALLRRGDQISTLELLSNIEPAGRDMWLAKGELKDFDPSVLVERSLRILLSDSASNTASISFGAEPSVSPVISPDDLNYPIEGPDEDGYFSFGEPPSETDCELNLDLIAFDGITKEMPEGFDPLDIEMEDLVAETGASQKSEEFLTYSKLGAIYLQMLLHEEGADTKFPFQLKIRTTVIPVTLDDLADWEGIEVLKTYEGSDNILLTLDVLSDTDSAQVLRKKLDEFGVLPLESESLPIVILDSLRDPETKDDTLEGVFFAGDKNKESIVLIAGLDGNELSLLPALNHMVSTVAHEIGHALGLGHDWGFATVMSYNTNAEGLNGLQKSVLYSQLLRCTGISQKKLGHYRPSESSEMSCEHHKKIKPASLFQNSTNSKQTQDLLDFQGSILPPEHIARTPDYCRSTPNTDDFSVLYTEPLSGQKKAVELCETVFIGERDNQEVDFSDYAEFEWPIKVLDKGRKNSFYTVRLEDYKTTNTLKGHPIVPFVRPEYLKDEIPDPVTTFGTVAEAYKFSFLHSVPVRACLPPGVKGSCTSTVSYISEEQSDYFDEVGGCDGLSLSCAVWNDEGKPLLPDSGKCPEAPPELGLIRRCEKLTAVIAGEEVPVPPFYGCTYFELFAQTALPPKGQPFSGGNDKDGTPPAKDTPGTGSPTGPTPPSGSSVPCQWSSAPSCGGVCKDPKLDCRQDKVRADKCSCLKPVIEDELCSVNSGSDPKCEGLKPGQECLKTCSAGSEGLTCSSVLCNAQCLCPLEDGGKIDESKAALSAASGS